MVWLWNLILSFLVWLSADTQRLAAEPARCAAAVAAARATLVGEGGVRTGVESVEESKPTPPKPAPKPAPSPCVSGTCKVKR